MTDERPHEMIRRLSFWREGCACGVVIEAPTSPSRLSHDVFIAVRRHNKSIEHVEWRRREGIA